MKDKLQQFFTPDISFRLNQIGELFKEDEEVKITLIVRTPKLEDGGFFLRILLNFKPIPSGAANDPASQG